MGNIAISPQPYTYQGRVVSNEKGKGLSGATVTIYDNNAAPPQNVLSTITDGAGNFTISNVPIVHGYDLEIKHDWHEAYPRDGRRKRTVDFLQSGAYDVACGR